MSYDFSLVDNRGHVEGEWNYTYNIAPMMKAAMGNARVHLLPANVRGRITQALHDGSWKDVLYGLDGAQGAHFLHVCLQELESDPMKYEELNPKNGWGDYKSWCALLHDMIDSVPEWPCEWRVT